MTQIFTPLVLHLSDWWLCIDNPCQNSPNKQILYVGQAKARSWTILLDNSHCRDAARYCREIVTISRWDVFCWHNCLQKMYTHRSQELELYQRNACRTSRKLPYLFSIFGMKFLQIQALFPFSFHHFILKEWKTHYWA